MTGIVCNACWQSFMPIQAMFEELRKASHCQELFPQRHIESKQEALSSPSGKQLCENYFSWLERFDGLVFGLALDP